MSSSEVFAAASSKAKFGAAENARPSLAINCNHRAGRCSNATGLVSTAGIPAMIGVGAAFDFHSGNIPWCPRWIRNLGLEWAYRLGQEPRRLVKRYVTDAAWLIPMVVMVLHQRLTAPRAQESSRAGVT